MMDSFCHNLLQEDQAKLWRRARNAIDFYFRHRDIWVMPMMDDLLLLLDDCATLNFFGRQHT